MRVDSSMVSEASGCLPSGIDNKSGRKTVKYSIAFDRLLLCEARVFIQATYAGEDIALSEVLRTHIKQDAYVKDSRVYLYTSVPVSNKRGT